MFTRLLVLKVFLTLIICNSLNSQSKDRWVYFESDDDGKFYVDKETLDHNVSFDYYAVWIKYIRTIPKYNEYNKKYTAYELYTWVVYCKSRKISEKEYYIYYEDGTFFNSAINESYTIPPESIGETLYNILCK
jgi:hypothetical protein